MNDDLIIRSRARHEFEKFFTDSERLQHDCDSILCMIPAVDAVEVVRCRDCKFSRELVNLEKMIYLDNCRACVCPEASQDGYMIVFPEHYCSYGERRTDEQ